MKRLLFAIALLICATMTVQAGDPLKKMMKYWYEVDQKDPEALSTEQALQLKGYLEKASKKQKKRGKILFWSSFGWFVPTTIIGLTVDEGAQKAVIGAGCALFAGQMTWGYVDLLGARQKKDKSRLVIASAPMPIPDIHIGDGMTAELGLGICRDNLNNQLGLGPSLVIHF